MIDERLLFKQMLDLYASQREADQKQCAKHVGAVQWQARHSRTVEAGTPRTKEATHHEPD